MAYLAPQQVPVTGITPAFVAASAGGDSCQPDDRILLRVKNTGASATVTIVVPGADFGQANPDVAVTIPATTGDVLIDLPPGLADLTTGLVSWTYSAAAALTVTLVRA